METNLGFNREYLLKIHTTPAGLEFVLLSPWGTTIKKWTEEPPLHAARKYAMLWAAAHPEHTRPEVIEPPKRSALNNLRNRLALALWVR